MHDPDRRTVLKSLASTGTLLAGGSAVGAARREGASGDATILDVVEANDDFETLGAALEETGLDAVLGSDDAQYTVFAPTDEAFADLLEALGVSAEELLARDDLDEILLFHATNGRRYASSVVNAPRIETLSGETLPVDGTTLNGGGVGGAEIIDTDIEASNGVVHVIDGVLLP